jgi:uncharacterized protein (DUF4415 family)
MPRLAGFALFRLERPIKMKKQVTTRKSSGDDAIDYSDIPKLDERFFANAVAIQPQTLMAALGSGAKEQITLRIDRDVIEFFKSQGKGYQRLMNFALRAYVLRQQGAKASSAKLSKRKPRSA